jgi:hypothetical protein
MKTTAHLFTTILSTLILAGANHQAMAGDLSNFSTISQTEFLSLSKDIAAAASTKPVEPATPMGVTGFDVSGSTALTQTQATSAWSKVTGSDTKHLPLIKLSATKGLPWGLDVGVFTAKLPTTNITVNGVHAKYALIDGNSVMPAVALRASHSRINGVSQMDLNNTSYDVLISKGFVGFTPYAGVGTVRSKADAKGVSTLTGESFNQQKTFVGASWNVLLLNLSGEYDRTGQTSTYSLKAGLRF